MQRYLLNTEKGIHSEKITTRFYSHQDKKSIIMLVKHDYRIAKIRKKDFSIENVNNDQEEGKQKDNLVSECPYGIV